MSPFSVLRCASACLALCAGCTPGPGAAAVADVPVVPDAVVDVAFADVAGFVDVAGRLGRAGLVPTQALSQSGLEAAGLAGPVVLALRGSGDLVVSARVVDVARLHTFLALAVPSVAPGAQLVRRLGGVGVDGGAVVDAVVVDGVDVAVVAVGRGVVVAVVGATDPLAAAALADALVTGRLPAPTRTPEPGKNRVTVARVGDVKGAIGSVVVVDAGSAFVVEGDVDVDGELSDVVAALASPAPDFACALEDGAALSVRLPPAKASSLAAQLGGVDEDAFAGRVVVAVHDASDVAVSADDQATWAHLAVGAAPRTGAAAGLKATLLAAAPGATARTVAGRTVHELSRASRPWRTLSAVVDDDRFVVGVGAPVVVDRAAAATRCPPTPERLLSVDSVKTMAIVNRASPTLALLRAAGLNDAALPRWLQLLEASARVDVDAAPVAAGRAHVRVRVALR